MNFLKTIKNEFGIEIEKFIQVDLPKEGITGNSYFMFQEKNNKEIADHIEKWLSERGLN